ncbi:MAG: NAD(P)-binding domain-containing protein [Pseudomonadota bacterium]
MPYVTTVIIGAGPAGLAMSKCLADRSIDHVVLERGEVGNSWATERWDSLRLLTPNWQSRLPGYRYQGDDPNGYMKAKEAAHYLRNYAIHLNAPIQNGTTVTAVRPARSGVGYEVATDRGLWTCHNVIMASGACNIASRPKCADDISGVVRCITPKDYRRPDDLEDGKVLVVGASATGVQLAQEIQRSGRDVIISVGDHIRLPRHYRGRDIKEWMDRTGVLGSFYTEVDDLKRARSLPSLQLIGSHAQDFLDLNTLQDQGVRVVGRLAGFREGKAMFSGSLANFCVSADLKMNRFLDSIDDWIEEKGETQAAPAARRFAPTRVDERPALQIDLDAYGIKTVLFATGYRPDYSWLKVPVLDRKGRLIHDGGVTPAPGLYAMGLSFMRRRKSTLIDGVGDDAHDIADHLTMQLGQKAA